MRNAMTVYVCALCNEQITGRSQMSKHSKERHEGKVAKCDVCEFTAVSIHKVAGHRLSAHNLTTEGFQPYYCDRGEGCTFKTLDKDKLPAHVASVHDKIR